MTLLSIAGLGKRYGRVAALDQVSLEVPAGGRTAVVGPSGSGKTTLLRLIAGFEAPDAGRILLGGAVMADGPAMVPAHKRGIGIVAQDGALFPHLSVAENIGFGLPRGTPEREDRICALLDMVELDRRMLERRPHQLSGGQQQRVALAREPRLMLLDEPFSALDTGLRESMRKAVARVLQAAGITAILVTHDQGEALSFADQVAVLREGRLVQAGTPREIYRHPRDRETALFLGDAVLLPAIARNGHADCALGRVAVPALHRGKVEIMLRPEQIRVVREEGGVGQPNPCPGVVVDVEFSGAVCTVAVALEGVALPPILIKTSSVALPEPGERVRLDIAGAAHVF